MPKAKSYQSEPEKKRTADCESCQAEPEKKRTAERESYIKQPEKRRAAKRQQYWESPTCKSARAAKSVIRGASDYTNDAFERLLQIKLPK